MNLYILRRHGLAIIFLLVISAVASLRLFTGPFYSSHDGEGHAIRMIEFHEALTDGQFPVRLAKRINYGLGYPFFNFNYPLVYYLGEGFHLAGLSFADSFKALMVLSVVLGAFSMYAYMLGHTGRLGAVIAATVFTIAPYKFLNMYVRANPAESLGLALIPFLLLSIDALVRKNRNAVFLVTLSHAVLLLTHNITAGVGYVFVFLYMLYALRTVHHKKEIVFKYIGSVVIALLLTAFFWVPVFIETKITRLVELSEDYKNFFPTFREIIYSPWGFGGFKQGEMPGKMSPEIGLVHTFLFVISIIFLTGQWPFFIISSLVFLFLALPYSQFIWDAARPLQYVQLPWRFVGFIILGISITTGVLMTKITSRNLMALCSIILIVLLLYTNRNHIRVNQYLEFHSPFEQSEIYGPSTTSKDEHMPRWAPRIYIAPVANGEVFPVDQGISTRTLWKSNKHIFTLTMKTGGQFRDNTSYFPGWRAYLDNIEVPILYQSDPMGRLRVAVPTGQHTLEFRFGEPWYRVVADLVSVISFIIVIWISLTHLGLSPKR